MTATDEENDAISYSITGGADSDFFEINSSTGALTFSGTSNNSDSMLASTTANNSPAAIVLDNLVMDGTTATIDLYAFAKSGGVEGSSLISLDLNSTAQDSDISFTLSETLFTLQQLLSGKWQSVIEDGYVNVFTTNSDGDYITPGKIGSYTITNFDIAATNTITGITFSDLVNEVTSQMVDITLVPITTPPANGANDDDIYTVEVTATDANNATTAQTLSVTVAATSDTNHASVTSDWTGTESADTFIIDEYSGLTITANGGDGGNDTAKLAVLDHVLWDTTSGGTTELTASLVDMEIIDIGAVLTTYDSSNAQSIADFSTHLLLDATS
ncbi:MAG: cadherin repeat domain-containing protein, partial [Gammaproteobacteria bacterium]|nr:cadherin repeat domain-containing protein [Gammaproteobacteria bacterium]